MRIAYFTESPADQAALTILTEAILGKITDAVSYAGLRHRGWPAVRTALPAVLKELHFHTDAEGFVFIVDSNGSQPHVPSHEPPGEPDRACRLCQLRRIASQALEEAGTRPHQPPLKVAIGLAVPAIEAWLLCGVNAQVNEAAWINGLKERRNPYTRAALKEELYGTSRPSLDAETKEMTAAATRLATSLDSLETQFPHGFGTLRGALRAWWCEPVMGNT